MAEPFPLPGIERILEANFQRLATCPGPHAFRRPPVAGFLPWQKRECATCGGTVSEVYAEAYSLGLEHGRRQARAAGATPAVP